MLNHIRDKSWGTEKHFPNISEFVNRTALKSRFIWLKRPCYMTAYKRNVVSAPQKLFSPETKLKMTHTWVEKLFLFLNKAAQCYRINYLYRLLFFYFLSQCLKYVYAYVWMCIHVFIHTCMYIFKRLILGSNSESPLY